MNASRNFGTALLLGLVGAVVGIALLVVFIFPSGSQNENPAGGEPQSAQAETRETQQDSGQNNQERNNEAQEVSREEAREIAVEHLGGGEVTWIGREDDHGALWEVEVTGSEGNESNVYVTADGEVSHVEGGSQNGDGSQNGGGDGSGGDQQPAPEPAPDQSQNITAQQAGEIAASHVGGTVDEIYQESGDYGAAWDVDVYTAEGEYTIYVSAAGEVVRVEGPFDE